ncbi:MAG: hypothetical protein OEV61_07390 [Chloroflexota bacterium]|jgi:hypothetical protein|nr:hypothetical protein [Chloroflexota bacterium]
MPPVTVRILHPLPDPSTDDLVRWVGAARSRIAERHRRGFERVGASDVQVIAGGADGRPFGARLRESLDRDRPCGLVILGSGSMPLATASDRRAFVRSAQAADRQALANNRYSADVVAIARADLLPDVPDLATDNLLPRWLSEAAGYRVADLRRRWRLAVDVDGPLDLLLADGSARESVDAADRGIDTGRVAARLDALRAVTSDIRAELVVAGRTSAAALAWLEHGTRSRTRALVEERGLRTSIPGQRPPAAILGMLLDRDGPGSLAGHLARLGDGAILDTRVLLAHRLGANEAAWPVAADRFASDLLLHERIADPWLAELTRSAAEASIPIVLGGHTIVGPGLRLALRSAPPR